MTTSETATRVLIAGAGLAGLSAALHLGDEPYRLVEPETSAGGLCRSIREEGFTFDHTGHLLHLRRPEIRGLVLDLVGDEKFLRIDRRSGVYSKATYTEYPFQVNTHGLPRTVVRDCVMGFAETLQQRVGDADDGRSFHDWVLATFGRGIAEHFMFPYNEKLFCTDLRTVTADWVSWSIPKPSWADVIRGAEGRNAKAFGYNPQFLYPAAGGIDLLPRALLARVRPPTFATAVSAIELRARRATLSDGSRVCYERLISTMPLPRLLERCDTLPPALAGATGRLRHVGALNLNLGFDAPCPKPYHWVYFPEPAFPFYRVGVYSNLCPASVPAGWSSFYVEISVPPGARVEAGPLAQRSAALLRDVGLVPRTARLRCVRAVDIPFAYVIHDRARREILPAAHRFLESHGVLSVGRYGAWEYSAMEDAIWQGRVAAERALGRSPAAHA